MTMPKEQAEAITPAESLSSLPKLVFEPEKTEEESEFRRAELLQSVLTIARIDHIAESQLVREAVKNALGKVPDIGN
jgi:hypothetical protein